MPQRGDLMSARGTAPGYAITQQKSPERARHRGIMGVHWFVLSGLNPKWPRTQGVALRFTHKSPYRISGRPIECAPMDLLGDGTGSDWVLVLQGLVSLPMPPSRLHCVQVGRRVELVQRAGWINRCPGRRPARPSRNTADIAGPATSLRRREARRTCGPCTRHGALSSGSSPTGWVCAVVF